MKPARITPEQTGQTLRKILEQGYLRPEDTAACFLDIHGIERRLAYLIDCFPAGTLHTVAIKSNPLSKLLQRLSRHPACGAEAASAAELVLALRAGFPPEKVVFDSPVKTISELTMALEQGVHINADNPDELARIDILIRNRQTGAPLKGTFGLRINPQVGAGTIAETSVAGTYSKFGVPARSQEEEIHRAFLRYPWLTGVHLHVGSQGCHPGMLAEGISIVCQLADSINQARTVKGFPPVNIFDIGGGLPISYHDDQSPPDMRDYAAMIREQTPGLFLSGKDLSQDDFHPPLRLVTEFGRWMFTNSGWTVSRVEYVKHDQGISTALLHAGADMFVRECLSPAGWNHQYLVFDQEGFPRSGVSANPWNLAGPLCFSGDIMAKNQQLPDIRPGDLLVIRDTGGYTFSMWSKYNSRQFPRVIGFADDRFTILKERESPEEAADFWI